MIELLRCTLCGEVDCRNPGFCDKVTDMNILQELYDSEINFSMACFWDGGIDWKLGDEVNGFKAMGCNDKVEEAINAIGIAAKTHYAESTFAKNCWVIAGKLCMKPKENVQEKVISSDRFVYPEPIQFFSNNNFVHINDIPLQERSFRITSHGGGGSWTEVTGWTTNTSQESQINRGVEGTPPGDFGG